MTLDGGGRSERLERGDDVEVSVSEWDDRGVFEWWWKEERWVVEVPLRCEGVHGASSVSFRGCVTRFGIDRTNLRGHDSVAASEVEALLDVLEVEDVPVGENGHLDGLLDGTDLLPVCEPLQIELQE